MAQVWADRVKEESSTTGTGALTLSGAVTGFRTFASVCANADTACYCVVNRAAPSEWEVGLGTWNTGGTLTRTTVYASSNSGNAVNFSSGVKDVFLTYPATALVSTFGATLTGALLLPSGSATAPSVGWSADADGSGTGLYRSAANQIATAINGSLTHLFVASRFLIRSNSADITFGTSDDVSLARRSAGTAVAPLGGSTFSAATNSVTLGGVANGNTTSQATTGTVEEVLATYTLPANALSANGKGVRITAWGTTATNGNSKVFAVRFGGIAGLGLAATTTASNGLVQIDGVVIRTGAATQEAMFRAAYGATGAAQTVTQSRVVPTANTAATIDIVVTGTTPTQAGDVTFRGMIVEFFN